MMNIETFGIILVTGIFVGTIVAAKMIDLFGGRK